MKAPIVLFCLVTTTGTLSAARPAGPCRDARHTGDGDYRQRLEKAHGQGCREPIVLLNLALVWLRAHVEEGETVACQAAELLDSQTTSPLVQRLPLNVGAVHVLCRAEQVLICLKERTNGWDELRDCAENVCSTRTALQRLDGHPIADTRLVVSAGETLVQLNTLCAHTLLGQALRHRRQARLWAEEPDLEHYARARRASAEGLRPS